MEPGYFTVVTEVGCVIDRRCSQKGDKENLEVAIGATGKQFFHKATVVGVVGLDMVTGWSRGRRIASGTVGVVTTIDGLDG